MEYSFDKILEDIQKDNFKVFEISIFKSKRKVKEEILVNMPDYDLYLNNKNKILQRQASFENFYLEEPVLTKQQEYHLFRKMHYFKYLCKKNFNLFKKNKLASVKKKIISFYGNYQELRHLIHKANLKLVSQSLKKRRDFYGNNHLDDLFSDAFMNILQAIDHFDYRRNIKFSTFACWCLLNNSIRDHQKNKKFELHNTSNCEQGIFEKNDDNENDAFLNYENKESGINDWSKIKEFFLKCNKFREITIIEKVFGLGGAEKKSIAEIATEFNLTKERIRQLREKTLGDIKTFVKIGKIKIDGI